MNTLFAGIVGGWEIVLILAVVLILFGAKKIPELAKGLGHGIKEFKKATTDVTNEIQRAGDTDDYQRQVQYRQPEKTVEGAAAQTAQAPQSPAAPKA